jgi:ribonuclease G
MAGAVMARILAKSSPGEIRIAVTDGAALRDYAIWRPGAPDGVGDLHRGRVLARVPALAGAFVLIEGAEGFLPDTEGASRLTEGTIIGVRVTRAAQSGKGPRLSAALTPEEAALVGGGPPALLRRGPGPLAELAAYYKDAPILADSSALAAKLRPVLGSRVDCASTPLWDETTESAVEEVAAPVVAFQGGGRISIHPTPALTAIDIDIGGAAKGTDNKGRAHVEVNMAALPVLARQIRLRNLSGAILVDWAGLSPRRRAALGPALAAALAEDRLRPRLLGFTALGLAEIVRPRVHPPLHELLVGPHAAGLAGLRQLVTELAADPSRPRALRAAPPVITALQQDRIAREDVIRLTGRPLTLRADPSLGSDECLIDLVQ